MDDTELITKHSRYVYSVAHSFTNNLAICDDLAQEGLIALLKAHKQWDPTRKVTFLSYVKQRIRGAMIDYIRTTGPHKRNQKTTTINETDLGRQKMPTVTTTTTVTTDFWLDFDFYTKGLSQRDKLILRLRLNDFNFREISKIIGVSQAYIFQTIKRVIRPKLQAQLRIKS